MAGDIMMPTAFYLFVVALDDGNLSALAPETKKYWRSHWTSEPIRKTAGMPCRQASW